MTALVLDQVYKPTLLVDLQKVRKNIAFMLAKAKQSETMLRPHFKTHQSARIGEIYKEMGVQAITVSSVEMANYFAMAGWRDILIAFPLNWREVDKVDELAARINLAVLVDCEESARFLAAHVTHEIGVWIKIDTGLHRAGIWWQDMQTIAALASIISSLPHLNLKGILTHAGQTYLADSKESVKAMASASKQAMLGIKEYLGKKGLKDISVSIGDTPSCRTLTDFLGVDEIRPGNFVFYDLEQWQLGVCQPEEIAVAVACPIVSRSEVRHQLVIYGGAIHFSKEMLLYANKPVYGMLIDESQDDFGQLKKDCVLTSLTQEHGVLTMDADSFAHYHIGEVVQIMPVHACLAAQALGEYTEVHTGEHIMTMVTKKGMA